MRATHVGKRRQAAQVEVHAHAVEVLAFRVSTAMENVTRSESKIIVLDSAWVLILSRRVSKLSRETDSLSQHNYDVTEALRRIRLDESLTPDGMRSAIDEVLAMVRRLRFIRDLFLLTFQRPLLPSKTPPMKEGV